MSTKAEVLIVGAGPVGLSAASALAQAKIPIRIIDKLPTPTDQSRAAIVRVEDLNGQGTARDETGEGALLSRRRYSCATRGLRGWDQSGEARHFKGVVLGEPGCA
jgi:2-polyprenyl-6-methoxyphenol hydroxylase-like FAD-dependent oxidoreductase